MANRWLLFLLPPTSLAWLTTPTCGRSLNRWPQFHTSAATFKSFLIRLLSIDLAPWPLLPTLHRRSVPASFVLIVGTKLRSSRQQRTPQLASLGHLLESAEPSGLPRRIVDGGHLPETPQAHSVLDQRASK